MLVTPLLCLEDRNMDNKFSLTVGDRYHDGHGLTDIVSIVCSHTMSEVRTAISDAKKKKQVPDRMCENYGDSKINNDLIISNPELKDIFEEHYKNKNEYHADPESWVKFHMWLASTELKNFKYEIITSRSIGIGGYGLFSC